MRIKPAKQSLTAAATRAMVARGVASSSEVEHLLGSWVWMMMPVRLSLSVLDVTYQFIRERKDFPACKLWAQVQAELMALVWLLPLLVVRLATPWHDVAYEVDASLDGFGAVATKASMEELRSEAQWCERRGWVVAADAHYSELEELVWNRDHDSEQGLRPPPSPRAENRAARFGFLELVCGSRHLSMAAEEAALSWIESWDKLLGERFDLTNPTILKELFVRLRAREWWMVHLAPPCAFF